MDDTNKYVEKLAEQKGKQEKNRQGNGHPDEKLPNVKHARK